MIDTKQRRAYKDIGMGFIILLFFATVLGVVLSVKYKESEFKKCVEATANIDSCYTCIHLNNK